MKDPSDVFQFQFTLMIPQAQVDRLASSPVLMAEVQKRMCAALEKWVRETKGKSIQIGGQN